MTRLVCTPVARCDYHADGGSKRSRCPGYCDARTNRGACRELATTETAGGRAACDRHATTRTGGRPVTTGSGSGPVVAFRLAAADQARAAKAAKRERVSVGELARRALLAAL